MSYADGILECELPEWGGGLVTFRGSVSEDGTRIAELVSRVLRGTYDEIHDLLIVKDNRLVLEECFRANGRAHGPFLSDAFRDRPHLLASATKSITSILVGIAIAEGFMADVDVPVFDLFPEYAHLREEGKEAILLRHLLTMTAGLERRQSNEDPGDVNGMWQADDVVAYCLAKPVVAEPGTEFTYSNGISTLLGAAVARASGLEADEFAKRYLLGALGIGDFDWARYTDGTVDTDGGLALRPRDLAKVGQVLLNDGRWGDRQVVPRQWIVESTKGRVEHPGRRWYGYQWWRKEFEVEDRLIASYHAWGWGGQYLFVFPDLEMIVVSNAGNFEYRSERHLFGMIESHILPAALSS